MRSWSRSWSICILDCKFLGLANLELAKDDEPFEVESAPMGLLGWHDLAHLNQVSDGLEAERFVS